MLIIIMENIIDEVIELTKRLIAFKSVSDNTSECKKCAEFIASYLKGLNVKVIENKGVYSIYASVNNTKKPKLMLNAHFDVVPASEEMFTAKVKGDKLIGRGALDNKGPLAIAMVLLKKAAKEKKDVALLTTSDEEFGGHKGMKYVLEKEKLKPEFVIVIDGGTLNEYIVKEKGVCQLRLIAKGKASHGSMPWNGVNAVEKLINAYPEVKKLFKYTKKDHWEKTLNLGMIKGGDAINKVPDYAEMFLDIRYTENDNVDKIISNIKKEVKKFGVSVEVKEKEPLFFSDANTENIQKLIKINNEVMGKKAKITVEHGASDARFLSPIPSIICYPQGDHYHTDKEYLDLKTLGKFIEVLERFVESI